MVLSVRVTKSLSASASLICTCDLVLNIIISPPLENCQQCLRAPDRASARVSLCHVEVGGCEGKA